MCATRLAVLSWQTHRERTNERVNERHLYTIIIDVGSFVVDPSLKEELISKAQLTVIANSHKELCCMQKSGGTPIPADVVRIFGILPALIVFIDLNRIVW
jgi:exosome complex RNA-binding protein Rrp42 (RNase PH superfamily)